jgi:hypothetical protein
MPHAHYEVPLAFLWSRMNARASSWKKPYFHKLTLAPSCCYALETTHTENLRALSEKAFDELPVRVARQACTVILPSFG